MKCPEVEELLESWQLRALVEDEEASVSKHLLACSRCRTSLSQVQALEASLTKVTDRVDLKERRPVPKPVMALALFLIAIFLGAYGSERMNLKQVKNDRVSDRALVSALSPEARYEFLGPRLIRLYEGGIGLDVSPGREAFEVVTDFGSVITKNASFHVSYEEERAVDPKSVLSSAGILTVGVLVGAVVFRGDGGDADQIGPGETAHVSRGDDKDDLRVGIVPRRVPRGEEGEMAFAKQADLIKNLQAKVKELSTAKASQAEEMASLRQEKEKVEASVADFKKRQAEGAQLEEKAGPRDIAKLLDLEPAREEALVAAFEQLEEKIKEQEKIHAVVKETDDGYQIEIPTWEKDWSRIQTGWNRDLAAILLPKEMDRFKKESMGGRLLKDMGGDTNRSIAIKPGPDGYSREETRKGNGMMMKKVSNGYADLDEAVGDLSHLIDN